MSNKSRDITQASARPSSAGLVQALPLSFSRRQFLAAMSGLALVGCGGAATRSTISSTPGSQKAVEPSEPVGYAANHPAISYSDAFAVELSSDSARFHRPVSDIWGMEYVSPGSRARFVSNAESVVIQLHYSALLAMPSIYNGVGCVLVDGVLYTTFEQAYGYNGALDVRLDFIGMAPRLIEVLMPYAACVELKRVTLDAGASLLSAPARPAIRCGFYGDSITQGFNAAQVDQTWAYRLSAANNWQMLNGGYAGYPCMPEEGAIFAQTPVDLGIYTIGFNDFFTQTPLASFQANFSEWIRGYRSLLPDLKLYCITPTYSSVSRPIALEAYRQVMRDVLIALDDPMNVLIEGESLSDRDEAAFPDGIHPSDATALQIAEALAARISA